MDKESLEFLVRFICESDAIENIAYDATLARRHLKQRRTRGHVGAILLLDDLASREEVLTEGIVKQTQSLIVAAQHLTGGASEIKKKYLGNWRDYNVRVGEDTCAPWEEVPSVMAALIEEARRWQQTCPELSSVQKIAAIARFHYTYLRIHPFVDGNGRSARALSYYLYRYAGLEPFVFTAADRSAAYYPCFRDPLAPLLMEEYFRERSTF